MQVRILQGTALFVDAKALNNEASAHAYNLRERKRGSHFTMTYQQTFTLAALLKGANTWAEGSYPFCEHGEWSVYRVGNKVL